jgi:WD40 repeat protein
VNDADYVKGGKVVASAHLDKCVRLYDLSSGQCVEQLSIHNAAVTSVCVSGGMFRLLHHICVFILLTHALSLTSRLLAPFLSMYPFAEVIQRTIHLTKFPDGQLLLSNSRDNTLKLIDMRRSSDGEVLQTFRADSYRNGCDWNAASFRYVQSFP